MRQHFQDCPIPNLLKDAWIVLLLSPKPARSSNFPEQLLEVDIPLQEYDAPNVEHLIIAEEEYNHWCDWVQQQYFIGGWWKASSLPYEGIKGERGLVVTEYLTDRRYLGELDFLAYNLLYEEGFAPPVPVNGWEEMHGDYPIPSIDEDGFCEHRIYWLLWSNDFF